MSVHIRRQNHPSWCSGAAYRILGDQIRSLLLVCDMLQARFRDASTEIDPQKFLEILTGGGLISAADKEGGRVIFRRGVAASRHGRPSQARRSAGSLKKCLQSDSISIFTRDILHPEQFSPFLHDDNGISTCMGNRHRCRSILRASGPSFDSCAFTNHRCS